MPSEYCAKGRNNEGKKWKEFSVNIETLMCLNIINKTERSEDQYFFVIPIG
jgi:hypothetical protein